MDNCQRESNRIYAGAAVVFAKPHFKEAFDYSQTSLISGQQSLIPFEYDYAPTPKVWLGLKGQDGLGIQTSYWQFDQDGASRATSSDGTTLIGAHAATIIFPANIFTANPTETLLTSSSLWTETLNLCGTLDTQFGGIDLQGAAGVRYVGFRQNYAASIVDGTGTPLRFINWERSYYGLGPTVIVDGKKRLGNTRLSAFMHGGGALLFGSKSIDRTVVGDQSPQPASPFLSLTGADEVVGVGEASLGLEWSTQLVGHVVAVRGSYDGQLWAEGGAPTLGFLGFQGFGIGLELRR
ncbi:MAG: Lpg1974 family pore-forming outer membrane protein [Pirellulaceae bacterium]